MHNKIELGRIKNSKLLLWLTATFFLISFLFVVLGVSKYQEYLNNKNIFKEYERLKVGNYKNYEQYGTKGIKLLAEVSPLNIFFNLSMDKLIKCQIDTTEIIDVMSSHRGKFALKKGNFFHSFSDFFIFFGSLIFILWGTIIYRKYSIKFHNGIKHFIISVFFRLFFLLFCICLLFISSVLFVYVMGIGFSSIELEKLFDYFLFSILLMSFFYFLGIFISTIKNDLRRFTTSIALWILIVIVIPTFCLQFYNSDNTTPVEYLNLSKLKTLMDFEKEVASLVKLKKKEVDIYDLFRSATENYMKTGYIDNELKEQQYQNKIWELFSINEKIMMIIPTQFYFLISNENSISGFLNQYYFLEKCFKIKKNFFLFYIKKRMIERKSSIDEHFIKYGENIINTEFGKTRFIKESSLITVIFTLLFFLLSILSLTRKLKKKFQNNDYFTNERTSNQFYFRIIENPNERQFVFDTISQSPEVSSLNKGNDDFIDFKGIKIGKLVKYFSKILNIDISKIYKTLEALMDEDIRTIFNIKLMPDNDIKFFKVALILSMDKKTIVINDFLRNENQRFHDIFFDLCAELLIEGKNIIYLSSEMYTLKLKDKTLNDIKKIDTLNFNNLKKINLR